MKISIPKETSLYLWRLFFEMNGLQQRSCWLMSHKDIIVDNEWCNEKWDELNKAYQLTNMEYQIALDDVKRMYVPSEYMTDEYQMTVDFSSSEVNISVKSC